MVLGSVLERMQSMNSMLFDERDLIQRDNHSTRIPVVLCLDTSGSMYNNHGIEALNSGVRSFYRACQQDSINRYGFDVAIVTFGIQGVHKEQDFRPVWNQQEIPVFSVEENGENQKTPMGRGIDLALKGLFKRKEEYKREAIGYKQPWLIVISDGAPTDDGERAYGRSMSTEDLRREREQYDATVNEVLRLQRERKLKVTMFGVGGQDFRKLSRFVIDKKVLETDDFSEFELLFEFLSQSISTHSGFSDDGSDELISPAAMLADEFADEGLSIRISDFSIDED